MQATEREFLLVFRIIPRDFDAELLRCAAIPGQVYAGGFGFLNQLCKLLRRDPIEDLRFGLGHLLLLLLPPDCGQAGATKFGSCNRMLAASIEIVRKSFGVMSLKSAE